LITRALVIGTNGEGAALAEQLVGNPGGGVGVVGFVEGSAPASTSLVSGLPVVGKLADLEQLIPAYKVELIVIATGALARDDMLDLYGQFAHREDVELRMSSGLFEILATGVRIQHAGAVPLMTIDRVRITGVDAVLKSLLDYTIALTLVIVLLPVLLLLAIGVKLDSGGPVIYRRRVMGRSGKPFDAFKLCTMIPDRRKAQLATTFPDRRLVDKSSGDPRVTRFGRFLRRSSLDELPQLINVLRGEMSLIGPRMVSPDEIERYGKWQLNLLTVKPGITGPWQVRGRSDIPYEERVRLSTEYIRNYTIWLDLEILLQTAPAILKGRGAY
jgi:exopolysaccharide biosynthesis polyprenyl glycosylphosphotransferase